MENINEYLKELGAKPSESEENGLNLLRPNDLVVFSPGISSGGFAEIRMATMNPNRRVVATTIDKQGLEFARQNINTLSLQENIITKEENLKDPFPYEEGTFDFIYARLVLHYLSAQDLDIVLKRMRAVLKSTGRIFVVVRSVKNLDKTDPDYSFDESTKLSQVPYRDESGKITSWGIRYFHTPETITEHLIDAGFQIDQISEYQEQLYKDFMRTQISPVKDHVIEVLAH